MLSEDEDKQVVILEEETSIEEDLKIIGETINNAIQRIVNKLDKGDKKMDIEKKESEIKESDKKVEDEKDEKVEDKKEGTEKESEEKESNETEEENKAEEKETSEESDKADDQGDEATEEVEEESVEDSEGDDVDLAEAEKEYNILLEEGKVLPVQKDEIISLLASKKTVNLSDGEKSISELVKSLLSKQKTLKFEEDGAKNTDDVKAEDKKASENKEEAINFYKNKMGISNEQAEIAFEELSKLNEIEG